MGDWSDWKPNPSLTDKHDVVAVNDAFWFTRSTKAHATAVEDFKIDRKDDAVEYITFSESPTKTRQGGFKKIVTFTERWSVPWAMELSLS